MKKVVVILILAFAAPLALAVAGCSGGRDSGAEESPAPPVLDVEKAVEAPEGEATAVGAPAGMEGSSAEGEGVQVGVVDSSLPPAGPKVIQVASLRLVVPRGKFDETVERARTITAGLGGFVVSSSAVQGDGARLVRGSLVVRVPGERYADAMTRLGRLGKIEGRDESGQDVSAQFVDLEVRARHLEAVERQLLELLDRAESVPAALAVQSQLNGVQLELEQVHGQVRYLADQVSYATISLDLREKPIPVAGGPGDGGARGIVEAWGDGARAFVNVAAGVFVVLATIAPVVLLLLGVSALGRIAWGARRRARLQRDMPLGGQG